MLLLSNFYDNSYFFWNRKKAKTQSHAGRTTERLKDQ
jgi:hypothetical protein